MAFAPLVLAIVIGAVVGLLRLTEGGGRAALRRRGGARGGMGAEKTAGEQQDRL